MHEKVTYSTKCPCESCWVHVGRDPKLTDKFKECADYQWSVYVGQLTWCASIAAYYGHGSLHSRRAYCGLSRDFWD